ncbi:MAG: NADH:flavin oxidoreductase [Parahaliea sp.]
MNRETKLFEPFTLGELKLSNRIVMAPMTRSLSPGNVPNADVVEYYRRRAAGGVGLVITEGSCIGHPAANGFRDVPYMYGDEALAGWQKVVGAVHGENSKIAAQLWHVGAVRRLGAEPDPAVPGYGPSGMALTGKVTGHAMTLSDIEQVIRAYADAARDARRVGFDAVEIHAAHGYLIDQFFWQGTNKRTDAYGGSMANRGRFAVEIIKAVRAEVGERFPVIFRFSQWKQQDYGARLATTPEELGEFLAPLSEAGVDVFHCSTRRFWEPEFKGCELNLAGWTKKLSGKPTITVGSVGLDNDFIPDDGSVEIAAGNVSGLDELLQRLCAGEFDLVAVGRALIANPEWASLVRMGRTDRLRGYDKSLLASLD